MHLRIFYLAFKNVETLILFFKIILIVEGDDFRMIKLHKLENDVRYDSKIDIQYLCNRNIRT